MNFGSVGSFLASAGLGTRGKQTGTSGGADPLVSSKSVGIGPVRFCFSCLFFADNRVFYEGSGAWSGGVLRSGGGLGAARGRGKGRGES